MDYEVRQPPASFISDAKYYFQSCVAGNSTTHFDKTPGIRPRQESLKDPVWEKAYTAEYLGEKSVVVPVNFKKPFLVKSNFGEGVYSINDITYLVIYKNALHEYTSDLITFIPDKSYSVKSPFHFSGFVLIEEWNGEPRINIKIESNGSVRTTKTGLFTDKLSTRSKNGIITELNDPVANKVQSITVCYTLSGYNYSAETGEYYYWTEYLGCDNVYFNDNSFTGGSSASGGSYGSILRGGGSGGIRPATLILIPQGGYLIENVPRYFDCFSNIPGKNYVYEVSVCVEQPEPGTRQTWSIPGNNSSSMSNPVFPGHVFLVLKQKSPSKTIIRNIGLYPAGSVTPYSPTSRGQLHNDSQREYDISLSVTMTSSQFFQILNHISTLNSTAYKYDINMNNCTDFALNALAAAGFYLPATKGRWLNGGGFNPGDLGEDIRMMELAPNMKRSTEFKSHGNQGDCY